MATESVPWPCPVCAVLVPVGLHDCPHCRSSAAWIDLMVALDFSIRHFHYCSLTGTIQKPQYRLLVDACRRRRDDMVWAAQAGHAVPGDTGLPPRTQCWDCASACRPDVRSCARCGARLDLPEVRLLRYQTFLCQEIRGHEQAGRLAADQARQLLAQTEESRAKLRSHLATVERRR